MIGLERRNSRLSRNEANKKSSREGIHQTPRGKAAGRCVSGMLMINATESAIERVFSV